MTWMGGVGGAEHEKVLASFEAAGEVKEMQNEDAEGCRECG